MSIILLQSCSKESAKEMLVSPQISTSTINATVKSDGTYQLSLENLENVSIAKQASHFQVSQTGPDVKTGSFVYKYQPIAGYIGSDEVLLSTSKKVVSTMAEGCHDDNGNGFAHPSTTIVASNISIKISVTKNQ